MQYPIILAFSLLLSVACSSIKQDRTSEIDKYINLDRIDSTKIIAAIKPYGYPWNKEGYLADVTRPIHQIDSTAHKYPNPFSPPAQICFHIDKSDSIKVNICNTDESSCIKIEEALLDSGSYCLGFQKLEVDGILLFKLRTTDSVTTKKMIFKRK